VRYLRLRCRFSCLTAPSLPAHRLTHRFNAPHCRFVRLHYCLCFAVSLPLSGCPLFCLYYPLPALPYQVSCSFPLSSLWLPVTGAQRLAVRLSFAAALHSAAFVPFMITCLAWVFHLTTIPVTDLPRFGAYLVTLWNTILHYACLHFAAYPNFAHACCSFAKNTRYLPAIAYVVYVLHTAYRCCTLQPCSDED